MVQAFIAYPSRPADLGGVIRRAKEAAPVEKPGLEIVTWERSDLAGYEIIQPILEQIQKCDIFAADVTSFNFNVTYELGYALGLGKRVVPIASSAFNFDLLTSQKIGIFDTLIRSNYSSYADILGLLGNADTGQRIATSYPYDAHPLFAVLPSVQTDEIAQLQTRARKAGLRSRTFDPNEQPRLGPSVAVRSVAISHGVVIPLLAPDQADAPVHNLRCAFVAGIAHALEKPTLLIKKGDWPAPLDVAEQVQAFFSDDSLNALFADFAARVHDARYASQSTSSTSKSALSALNFGDPAAENEEAQLGEYFLERGEFRQVVDGRAGIVIGRKGSGKTAVYVRARDLLRDSRSKIVVDLSPEGYQIKKLKDLVLSYLAMGSKEFLLSAFWEYVLLLEISAKIIDKDKEVHKRNHKLFEPYQRLLAHFRAETVTEGIDFSDRLTRLTEKMSERYLIKYGNKNNVTLSASELGNMLYSTALADLRRSIEDYAKNKDGVCVLFDNIDKGWNATGLEEADVIMIRTLIDASRKLKNDFGRSGISFQFSIFIRNDIYDMLLSHTPDRGKDTKVQVDWTDRDLLKQIIRKRFIFNGQGKAKSIDTIWHEYIVPIVHGENSLDFMIERSLMRPRYLLRLLGHCLGSAINFDHERVDEEDIDKGLSAYSTDIVTEINLEIRDVIPGTEDILYIFLGEAKEMKITALKELISNQVPDQNTATAILTMLLWHGVVGLKKSNDEVIYIYDVNYDLRRLNGLISRVIGGSPTMQINPAFWLGLECI